MNVTSEECSGEPRVIHPWIGVTMPLASRTIGVTREL